VGLKKRDTNDWHHHTLAGRNNASGAVVTIDPRTEVPSTSGGTNKRRTDSAYDATTGVLTTRTIDGFESPAALPAGFKATSYSYNSSGEVATIDPPGFGTADVTTFTYLANRNGHVAGSRTDPLVGTTTYGYDGLNRRTSVTDPNQVETVTSDNLNRVTEVRRKGATPAGDLVTAYTYTAFGDLFCSARRFWHRAGLVPHFGLAASILSERIGTAPG
jgi:YD repeat-containing protein